MAVFQKIRDNSLLSLIVIGGGLFLFIIGDSFKSGPSSSEENVGEFDGMEITQKAYDDYLKKMLYVDGVSNKASFTDQERQQNNNRAWSMLLVEKIFEKEAASNGIEVTPLEVEEMMAGENLSPFYVYNLFNGQENYQRIRAELASHPEDYANRKYTNRSYAEGEMLKDVGVFYRKREKLLTLLKHSFFTTTSEAKNLYEKKYTKKSIDLATVPYYLVPDSLVEVNDAEIRDFYNKNKGKYKVYNSSKKVIFGAYNIEPTAEDDSLILADAKDIVTDFSQDDNEESFIRSYSDVPFDGAYYKKGSGLATELDNVLFDKGKGFVYGPYQGYNEGNKTYNVAKVMDVQMMADSAKVKHILLTPFELIENLVASKGQQQPTQEEINDLWKTFESLVDSVTAELDNGKSFASVAKTYSKDSVSAVKGGDLGWIQEKSQAYAPAFLDSVFLENSSQSTYKKVRVNQQNGMYYYHVVAVSEMGKKAKKVKVGVVTKSVLPSEETKEDYYNKLSQVAMAINAGGDLIALKDSFDYYIDSAIVQPQQYLLNDLKGARSVVKWAFNEDSKGESKVFDLDRKYIVAIAVDADEAGYKAWDNETVKGEIENKVKKQKKAAYIAEKLGELTAEQLAKISELFPGATRTSLNDVVVNDGVANLAHEGALTGAVAALGDGAVSNVIVGLDAAYYVKVNSSSKAEVTADSNFDIEKTALKERTNNYIDYLLQEIITDKIGMEDNRQVLQ